MTAPGTLAPPVSLNENVAVVIVAALIASLKVAVTTDEIAMPVAPFNGVVAVTVGAVTSGVVTLVADVTDDFADTSPAFDVADTE